MSLQKKVTAWLICVVAVYSLHLYGQWLALERTQKETQEMMRTSLENKEDDVKPKEGTPVDTVFLFQSDSEIIAQLLEKAGEKNVVFQKIQFLKEKEKEQYQEKMVHLMVAGSPTSLFAFLKAMMLPRAVGIIQDIQIKENAMSLSLQVRKSLQVLSSKTTTLSLEKERNPFVTEKRQALLGLQDCAVEDFKLVGVMLQEKKKQAFIQSVGKHIYTVTLGDTIGSIEGIVAEIGQEAVVVKERGKEKVITF